MLGGKLKDAATRCVLTTVDTSKCVRPGPRWGSLQRSNIPPSWIYGRGIGSVEWKGIVRERKRKGKIRKGREKRRGKWKLETGVCVIGFWVDLDAPK